MSWHTKAAPTPANIRRRLSAAQEAITAAMDLIKKRPDFGKAEQKMLRDLDNAYAWVVPVQRKLTKR